MFHRYFPRVPWSVCIWLALIAASVAVAEPRVPATEHQAPGPLPDVSPDHPRLWFNQKNLARFRERWNDPFWRDTVELIVAELDDKRPRRRAVANGLCYLATGEARYADTAIDAATQLFDQPLKIVYDARFAAFGDPVALVFDWCYDRLGHRRHAFVRELQRRAAHWEQSTVNHFITHEIYPYLTPYLTSVLALEAEAPADESHLAAAYHTTLNWMGMMDEQAGGGDYRSYFYQTAYTFYPFLWDAASDSELVARSGFLRSLPTFLAYRLHPDGHSFMAMPDDRETSGRGTEAAQQSIGAGMVLMIASALDDPVSQWLGESIREHADLGSRLWNNRLDSHWLGMVHYDPAQPAASPAEAGLPLARRFTTTAISRSGWSNWQGGDDVVVTLYAGAQYSHMRRYQNHFDIWRGDDDLAVRGGNYYGSPAEYRTYSDSAISRNCLSFVPVGSDTPDVDGDQRGGRDYDATLDVTHYPITSRHGYLPHMHYRGEITRVEDGDGYAILSGEAGVAYEQVEHYRRDVIHLRPNIIIIHDAYAPAIDLAHTRWVLHSRHRPELEAPRVVAGGPEAGILESTGKTFSVVRGDSQLHVALLAPQQAKMLRAIGGEGFEDYVDGRNYDPILTHQGAGGDRLHARVTRNLEYSRGQWRTELHVAAARGENQIVVAMQVGPAGLQPEATFETWRSDDGLAVLITAGDDRWTVRLPKGSDVAPTVERVE